MIARRAKSVLLAVLMILVLLGGTSTFEVEAATYGDYEYVLINDNTEVRITGYTGAGGNITIPYKFSIGLIMKKDKKVTQIGYNAFYNKNLTSITIPNGVTSIGERAFAYNQLTSIVIPYYVTTVGRGAFKGNQLTSAYIKPNISHVPESLFENNQLSSVTIPDNVVSISNNSFKYNKLTSVFIPKSLTSIALDAFDVNPANMTFFGEEESIAGGYATSKGYNSCEYQLVDDGAAVEITGYSGAGDAFEIPDTIAGVPVTSIRDGGEYTDGVFYNSGITSVVFPDTLTEIGDYAFSGSELADVTIPDSVMRIGNTAFGHNSLTSVSLGSGIVDIEDRAFEYNDLTSVTIPDDVTDIGMYAFNENQLTSVTLGSSVESIGYGAFSNNQLTSVTIPDSTQSIGSIAFRENLLESLTIGIGVTDIGDSAFDYNNLNSVTIPGNVSTIGSFAFQFNDLESITIESGVTEIGEHAFKNNKLTSLTIPDSVTSIGGSAFKNNNLTTVTIPSSVTSIYDTAFDGNQTAVPAELTIYGDTGSDAETIAKSKGYTFVSSSMPLELDYEYELANGGEGVEITEYTGPEKVSVTIPSHIGGKPVTSIGEHAFYQKHINAVTIPDSVEIIKAHAFSENVVLNSAIIGNGVKTIEHHAFHYNRLTSLTIGNSVENIADYAFYSNELTDIIIPDSVVSIGNAAFGYSPLVSATIPHSVVTLDENVFANNRTAAENLIIYGYTGSSAEMLAKAKGYTFKSLGKVEFDDMTPADWFYESVAELVRMGGISGYPDGTFGPTLTMKRGEFVKLIVGGMGYTLENAAGEHWSMNYVRTAKSQDLNLLDSKEFPESILDMGITRNEMAKIAVRAIDPEGTMQITNESQYKDIIKDYDKIPVQYQDYVLKAYSKGILTGYTDGEFKGDRTLNRAEAATVAIRIFYSE